MEIDEEICRCDCHQPGSSIVHCLACCRQCACGRKIKAGSWQAHQERCGLGPAPILPPDPEEPPEPQTEDSFR